MNLTSLLTAVMIAVGFVGWPVIGKYSKASGAWVGTFAMVVTTIVVAIISHRQLFLSTPSPKAFLVLTLAAVVNGVAVCLYSAKTTDPSIQSGAFVVVVATLMVIFAPILDWILNGSIPSLRQVGGFALAALAIYLIK